MASRKKKGQSTDLVAQADAKAPLDGGLLLGKAQELLRELEADLLARARGSGAVKKALEARHQAEKAQRRTADPLEVWERGFVTQVAASWFLSCVFVRTLEDRGLLGHARFAGPGALDSQRLFFEIAPSLTEREYMLTVFRELTRLPAARDLFDAKHNPVWMLGPSAEMAKKLLAAFRTPSADAPGLRFGQDDTRFLGDLYQDLSEDVRDRFALLQTPRFVEKYILDRTLDRAIERFGLDEATIIDPTCGSGHFLLGAFERLLDRRLQKEPGLDVRQAAKLALDAVYGADINPYAVAIARFRLTLAFLEKGGYKRLADAPELPLHLVVADSLLHNAGATQTRLMDLPGQAAKDWAGEEFALEDEEAARTVLHRTYAAVVGNPPYITVKDPVLRERYREMYPRSASGKYSLGAPFTERFFLLAREGGFVGTITANSFMKREFGRKLIEDFLPTVNLERVVNTSGAYIPGHGTPTVLLFGTQEQPQGDEILAVLAKRGEPATPEDPQKGAVWSTIAGHGDEIGFDNEFITVARIQRSTLQRHPWSLGGGGASDLKELLEQKAISRLGDEATIGVGGMSNADDVYIANVGDWSRFGMPARWVRKLAIGEEVRDWAHSPTIEVYFPYTENLKLHEPEDRELQLLWPYRSSLRNRAVFGGGTYHSAGRPWWEWHQVTTERYRTPLSITFAFVATHNHFVLDRGGKVFKQSAPIIKLKDDATEDDHLALLAYLNSSTACFWMKQVFFPKATATGDISVEKGKPEANRYEFAGTQMETLPVPSMGPAQRRLLAQMARELSLLAEERQSRSPQAIVDEFAKSTLPLTEILTQHQKQRDRLLGGMKILQEEIDWLVYSLYGLSSYSATTVDSESPVRPFEAIGDLVSAIPREWATRVDEINGSPQLKMIESPMFKRLWQGRRGVFGHSVMSLEEQVCDAARSWISDRAETVVRTADAPLPPSAFVRCFEQDRSAERVLAWLTEKKFRLGGVVNAESVPFLAAYRHTDSGLEKRSAWEHVWGLQRAEDRKEQVPHFDPPPKYDSKDYRDPAFWRLRGKLDVPKERFISYPGCESDEDKEPVFGWAGWNHLQQAQALANLYQARKNNEAWSKERLTPMLAGLLELIPWVKQWHNEPNPDFDGLRLGDYFESFLDGECHRLGITDQDLRDWRPPERTRAKKTKAPKATSPEPEVKT